MCAGAPAEVSSPSKVDCGQEREAKRQKKPCKKPLPSLMLAGNAARPAVTMCEKESLPVQKAPAKLWDASCILDEGCSSLYLGSANDALNEVAMRHHKITHVVNVTPDCPFPATYTSPQCLRIPVRDHCDAPLRQYFLIASEFIQKVREHGGNILVHCKSGISRSSTIIAAYLMIREGFSSEQAFEYLRALRPSVSPNIGFLLSLEAFQKDARVLNTLVVTAPLPSLAIGCYYKRKVQQRKSTRKSRCKPSPLAIRDSCSPDDTGSTPSLFILCATPTSASPTKCHNEARTTLSPSGDNLSAICCQ
ncbi:MAP kinase phosphatase with leucine-rich repeats protein 1 [Diplonema papillatum]|nr:MAP kinase phosphatase with leucine-rich repeats protein 1 [Diplonema papillatum]